MNQNAVVLGLLRLIPLGMAWLAESGNLTSVAVIEPRFLCLYEVVEFVLFYECVPFKTRFFQSTTECRFDIQEDQDL
jgi:hypothetical protein